MSDLNSLCPLCGEGNLHSEVAKNPVHYRDRSAELDLLFSRCDVCGIEQVDAAQSRANKRLMVAFKKEVDGLLVGSEVRSLRERLGLSQAEAALVFGGGPVAFSKYESDDVTQSEAMDKLLRLAVGLPAAFQLLCRRAGLGHVRAGEQWSQADSWLIEQIRSPSVRRPTLRVVSSSSPSTGLRAGYRDAA